MALRSLIPFRASTHPRILHLSTINNVVFGGSSSIPDAKRPQNAIISANKIRTRSISTSPMLHQAKRNKDLFTPSPFARRDTINISEKFFIHRELKEGDDYGIRRYLLLPRNDNVDNYHDVEEAKKNVVASLNANKNILFGAQLHIIHSSSSSLATPTSGNVDEEDYGTKYLAACGSLLDIAREDAGMNGQQVQALATLNGLCSWVKECLDKDGEGSEVLMGLMHGEQQPNTLLTNKSETEAPSGGKRSNQKVQNLAANLILKNESERIQLLDAVRAIATGEPRPGHSVVGVGTYRDGKTGWVALAREYSQLATNAEAMSLDASYVGRRGLEEMALYTSRGGEVTKIEHLAHTQPEYLREAGGAMARLFFV